MKDVNKVREFMEAQRKVARRAARAVKLKGFEITYIEFLPSLEKHWDYEEEREVEVLKHPQQRQLANSELRSTTGKQRIRVVIRLKGKIKEKYLKKLDEVMKRGYRVEENTIIYSVKPFH
ncbi:MAG: hypothetical protein HFJ57_05095 [Clostridia bacterium]|nr:hypothetical protein [Clostridia bacterium]